MAAAGFTPIQIYYSTTGAAVPTAANLLPGELGLNIADMKLYCENSSGVVTLLAAASGASGDVVGPASATDTAIALFDGATGKLIKNSGVTVDGSNNLTIPGQGDLRLADSDSSNWVAFQAPATVASNVTWTLPSADGSNGQVLQTNGTGTLSFANQTSLATPLAVVGNATAGAELRLPEDTDNGSNYVALKAPDNITANTTLTVPAFQTTASVGYLNVPRSGSAKTTSYSLATTDVGQLIEIGSGGSVTIPDATFALGDVVLIFNNTSAGITITCTITTAYIGGTDSDKATVTLATRGVANILFISGTVCVITGSVS